MTSRRGTKFSDGSIDIDVTRAYEISMLVGCAGGVAAEDCFELVLLISRNFCIHMNVFPFFNLNILTRHKKGFFVLS